MPKKLKKCEKEVLDKVQIRNISRAGLYILVKEQEYFLSFVEFPWFLKATIEEIYNLEFFHDHHLHWPALDIDIDVEYLKHPEL